MTEITREDIDFAEMPDVKHTADQKRFIQVAINHIASLCESNLEMEMRLKAARKAERKCRSTRTAADANCIGWFYEGVIYPAMPISLIASCHSEAISLTLLGALCSDRADKGVLKYAIDAHEAAMQRYHAATRKFFDARKTGEKP
jgi:hypothetical protein